MKRIVHFPMASVKMVHDIIIRFLPSLASQCLSSLTPQPTTESWDPRDTFVGVFCSPCHHWEPHGLNSSDFYLVGHPPFSVYFLGILSPPSGISGAPPLFPALKKRTLTLFCSSFFTGHTAVASSSLSHSAVATHIFPIACWKS